MAEMGPHFFAGFFGAQRVVGVGPGVAWIGFLKVLGERFQIGLQLLTR